MFTEWWAIDGCICIIIFAAALWGAVKGIGDTIIRIASIAAGIGLGVFYSDKISAFLMKTKMSRSLYEHIFVLLRGEEASPGSGNAALDTLNSTGDPESYMDSLSKSIGSMFDSAADRAADAAAQKLTAVAVSVIGFALILLTVAVLTAVIRFLIKHFRNTSTVLGLTDRLLGFVLGGVRGLLLAWIIAALLIPVTALLSPENVPVTIDALNMTTIGKVLYDVNPLLLAVKYVLK
jgi:uncharacterized membrane protein required for colicin V production